MFGINGMEAIALLVIAALVVGPERMPVYASKFARIVKEVRRMAHQARGQLADEIGGEVEWEKIDPRYIIKDVLAQDILDDDIRGAGKQLYRESRVVLAPLKDPFPPAEGKGAVLTNRSGDTRVLFDPEAT